MLALLAPIVLLCLILNRHEIWAAVRFGKIIVLPLFGVPSVLLERWEAWRSNKTLLFCILLLLVISQFAFAYRMAAWK